MVLTIFAYRLISEQYEKIVNFAQDNDYAVVVQNGVVSNMPARLKLLPFEGDTLAVWQWIQGWSDVDSLRAEHPGVGFFIGPKAIYGYSGGAPRSWKYPESFTATVDVDYLRNTRTGYSWIIFLVLLIAIYLISIPWAAAAILIFIAPFMFIKFSKAGMKFAAIWKLGMFMVSLHFLYFTIITVLRINIPYAWIFNFPLYVFVVAILVKIDPDDLERSAIPAGI